MDIIQITALLLILGTGLTYIGFGAFPPRIYTEKDVQEKLNLLAAHPRRWILCQTLVILGGIATGAGSIFLIPLFSDSQSVLMVGFGAIGLVLGLVFWIRIVGLRIVEPWRQAKGEFPNWLFKAFSILTLLGLASIGTAFWQQGIHRVLGVGLFLSALLVLGLFLKFKDMPPFVYYGMTLAIGLTLLF